MPQDEFRGPPATTRRSILATVGAGALSGIAGCGVLDSGDDREAVDPVKERVTVDPDDIVEGGTFRASAPVDLDTFDVPYSSSASASAIQNLLFEGMITVGADGQIYPWIAESLERTDVQERATSDYVEYMRTVSYRETENGSVVADTDHQIVVSDPENPESPSAGDEARVLTIEDTQAAVDEGTYGMAFEAQLHEGVTFHNGEELTADNVVASYYRYANSPNAGQIFDSLLHVEAAGDHTVKLYAQIPDAAAVRELGGLSIYPTESTDLPPRQMDPLEGNTPYGTGPWVLAEYEEANFIRLSRFDDYWFDTELKDWFEGPEGFPNEPVIDELDIAIVQDNSTRSAALQNGEIDMTYGLNAADLTSYEESAGFRTAATDGAGYEFLQYPVNSEPWTDKRLRKAVDHLIPRERITTEIYQGWEKPAWTPMPPIAAAAGTSDYEAMVERHRSETAYDRDQAEELAQAVIDERGLETPIQVTLETNSDNDDRVRTMELITESLNRSELFDAELTTREFLAFVRDLLSGQYPDKERLAFIGLSGGFNPHGYAKAIHSPENFRGCCNFQNIDIEEVNRALEEARFGVDVTEDAELRRERYEDVWDLVVEYTANSYSNHSINVGTVNSDVIAGYNTYPSTQDIIGYGLYAPEDQQLTYIDR